MSDLAATLADRLEVRDAEYERAYPGFIASLPAADRANARARKIDKPDVSRGASTIDNQELRIEAHEAEAYEVAMPAIVQADLLSRIATLELANETLEAVIRIALDGINAHDVALRLAVLASILNIRPSTCRDLAVRCETSPATVSRKTVIMTELLRDELPAVAPRANVKHDS